MHRSRTESWRSTIARGCLQRFRKHKRIAAFLFVWFLEKNGLLYHADGSRKLADNALVALTLMIAESKPEEKEMMTKVVVNLINLKN